MENKFYNFILAGCLMLCANSFAQDLAKDSIKVQKIINESANRKNGQEILTVVDKEKVAFISGYIDAKKLEQQKRSEQIKQTFESTPGQRYRKGDKTVIPQIISILKSRDRDKVLEVMYQLNDYNFTNDTQPLYLDPEIKAEFFKLATEDTFEKRVIRFLGTNKVDGHIAFFEQYLLSGKSAENELLFFWLAQDGKSEKAVDYFITSFAKMPLNADENSYWFSDGLGDFLKNGSGPVKKKIIDFAIAYTEKNPVTMADLIKQEKEGDASGFDPKTYFIQLVLASDDTRVPAFADKVEAVLGKFMLPNDRKELHDAMLPNLLRFYDFAKKKEAVLHSEPVKDDFMDLMDAVAKDKALLNDKEVAQHLMRLFEKSGFTEKYDKELFVTALKDMNKPVFESAVTGIRSAELRKLISEAYIIESKTLADNNSYLIRNGLIVTPVTQEQIKDRYKEDGIADLYDDSMYSVLQSAGISQSFDVEVGEYPAGHDELLLQFVKGSRGKITGLKALQQSSYDENSETSAITLFAVYNNKCFIIMPEDLGDWYDMVTFDKLLKAIVAEARIKEHFVPLNTGDQTAWYIFGEGEKVRKLANDYKLEVTESTGDGE
ncbi:hypothetical protein AAEO56_16885 [Flavobacterium sp. DGU11]|uniref:Uncharacterized protein n=1 Tax=Flavobacterium arundinis TaxID=3139143 RepID=A0ABU9I150_9FLAO